MNNVVAGRSTATWGRDVLAVLPAWVAARVLVAVGYVTAYVAINPTTPEPFRPIPFQQVLLAWDGAFYRLLADVGYVDAPADAHRFFPAYPLLGKVLSPQCMPLRQARRKPTGTNWFGSTPSFSKSSHRR